MHLAGCLRSLGELDRAVAELDRSIELTQFSGDRYIEAVAEWTAAGVEQARGRFAEAIAARRRELAILSDIGGNPQNQAMAHAHIAYLARRLGDEALAAAEEMSARNIARRHRRGCKRPAETQMMIRPHPRNANAEFRRVPGARKEQKTDRHGCLERSPGLSIPALRLIFQLAS